VTELGNKAGPPDAAEGGGVLEAPSAGPRVRPPREPGDGPALVSGTSTEFLGRKPLPRAVRHRPVVFLLGPPGVGKTKVALHLLGGDPLVIDGHALQDLLVSVARRRRWDERVREADSLVLDGPCFLHRRPAVVRCLQELVLERAAAGRRTLFCQAPDGSPMKDLVDALAPELRATIALRFPEGRGRRRYVLRLCDELGISARHALKVEDLDPWTYETVTRELLAAAKAEARRKARRRR
jgi:hypothetical protein